MSRQSARTLAIVLIVVGVVLIALGMVYFTIAANKLPAFLGQVSHATTHRTKRGTAAVALGAVSLLGGAWLAFTRERRRRHTHR
jgi:uncharacterized membrane protein YbhN (UPF0104 family)